MNPSRWLNILQLHILSCFILPSQKMSDMKSLRFHGNSFSHEFLFMVVFYISSNLIVMCQIHLWVPPKKMNSSSFKVIKHISYHANHCPYFLSIIIVVQMQQPVNLSFSNQNKIRGKHKTAKLTITINYDRLGINV